MLGGEAWWGRAEGLLLEHAGLKHQGPWVVGRCWAGLERAPRMFLSERTGKDSRRQRGEVGPRGRLAWLPVSLKTWGGVLVPPPPGGPILWGAWALPAPCRLSRHLVVPLKNRCPFWGRGLPLGGSPLALPVSALARGRPRGGQGGHLWMPSRCLQELIQDQGPFETASVEAKTSCVWPHETPFAATREPPAGRGLCTPCR